MTTRIAVLLALFWPIAGCGRTIPMVGGKAAPAAEGIAESSIGENGNTRLTVTVKHLASPERVSSAANIYVVWAQAEHGTPQNVGALVVDKNLDGRLETLTPLAVFSVFVTPEPDAEVATPSGKVLLKAKVIAKASQTSP